MNFEFNYKGAKHGLKVRECRSILSKTRGLMFKKNSMPLLFIFKRPNRQAIHSFFCRPFVAIWFNGEKVIDVKIIKNWKATIKPDKEFDKLLEVPSNSRHFAEFIDG